MKIHIKNMVCVRCERAVQRIFDQHHLSVTQLTLGLVDIAVAPDSTQLAALEADLKAEGFALVRSPEAQLVNQIKSYVTTYLDQRDTRTFSEALAGHLHADYGHLSRQFSAAEGRTLEHYLILQRVERSKELLQMKELTISEIAHQLGYRSNSHFSAQFKKHTHQTPTQYRKTGGGRQSLDQL